eukprot:Nitzschia sp. Nitz4//scaffold2_size372955//272889//282374//NITZ4_000454-RA/size372955-processed-gene-0.127-mRNA-1//-1//CDS//3329546871//5764//frame0
MASLSEYSSPSSPGDEASTAGNSAMDDKQHEELTPSSDILTPSIWSKNSHVKSLRQVLQVLRHDESLEPDSSLAAFCASLIPRLDHKDKQVRLLTVSACMELFAIYAPEAPWEPQQVLDIFRHTMAQLANLAHTSTDHPHWDEYTRILQLLAEVKIPVILVELAKMDASTSPTARGTRSSTGGGDSKDTTEALPLLADFVRTLLHSVRLDHPPVLAESVQATVVACLDEYPQPILLPIPLLDELLLPIGQGPKVLVVRKPDAAKSKPSRSTSHSGSKTTSNHLVEQTNPTFVLASTILRQSVERLSTPIAALINALLNNDTRSLQQSSISTSLLKEIGKPATQDQNPQADIYNIIYELHRVAPSILTTIIGTLANDLAVSDTEQRGLVVHLLGKLFCKSPALATSFRPCFRQWLERAQDLHLPIRLQMVPKLLLLVHHEDHSMDVQAALQLTLQDPVLEVRLATIHGLCDLVYRNPTVLALDIWMAVGSRITSKHPTERKDVLTGLAQTYFHHFIRPRLEPLHNDDVALETIRDAWTTDERWDWIPSRVFECASFSQDTDLQARLWQAMDDMLLGSQLQSSKRLKSTARAVGFAMLLDTLQDNARQWLVGLLNHRAQIQQQLHDYLEARSQAKKCTFGSEEFFTAQARAQDLLDQVAPLTGLTITPGERHPLLQAFHQSKDGHIFRILATIANATHSGKFRKRAMEELPNRVAKPQREWIKGVVRQCAMGDLINQDVVQHTILLAHECGLDDDWDFCRKFVAGLSLAVEVFPETCHESKGFTTLTELFTNACSTHAPQDIVTDLVGILSKTATREHGHKVDDRARKSLLQLARDGVPEQASAAVRTLVALNTEDSAATILSSLVTSSVLSNAVSDTKMITALSALTQLAEASPQSMESSRAKKMVQLILDSILTEDPTPNERRSSTSPKREKNSPLSSTCRKLCAAMEFLTAYTRSTRWKGPPKTEEGHKLVEKQFEFFSRILKNKGLPPTSKACASDEDRAALRQAAALQWMRLCDARLGLDQTYLGPDRWHVLSAVFLDPDQSVRSAVMEELGQMLTGNGKYSKEAGAGRQGMIPSFKFLSMLVLCTDGEHGADHSSSNGYAANVGKRSTTTKGSASACVSSMRKLYEVTVAQARANGPAAEEQFERQMKVKIMPEYVVPFAFHLLAFRKESPTSDSGDDQEGSGNRLRVLKRRLKWIFDPLVQSLGDSADNISFLIRMTDALGRFLPVRQASHEDESVLLARLRTICSVARQVLLSYVKKDINLTTFPGQIQIPAHLFRRAPKQDLSVARAMTTPLKESSRMFSKSPKEMSETSVSPKPSSSNKKRKSADAFKSPSPPASTTPATSSLKKQKQSGRSPGGRGNLDSSVRFSPKVSAAPDFSALSPIAHRASPKSPGVLLSSGEKTRGTTPPSALRGTAFSLTGATFVESPAVSSPRRRSSRLSKSQNSSSQSTSGGIFAEESTTAEPESVSVTNSPRRRSSRHSKSQNSSSQSTDSTVEMESTTVEPSVGFSCSNSAMPQDSSKVPSAPYPPMAYKPPVKSALSSSPHYSNNFRADGRTGSASPTTRDLLDEGDTLVSGGSRQTYAEAGKTQRPTAAFPTQLKFYPSGSRMLACVNSFEAGESLSQDGPLTEDRSRKLGPKLLELRQLELAQIDSDQEDDRFFTTTLLSVSRGNPQLGTSVSSTCLDIPVVENYDEHPTAATGLSTGMLAIHTFYKEESSEGLPFSSNIEYYHTSRHLRQASAVAWRPNQSSHVVIGMLGSGAAGASQNNLPRRGAPNLRGGSGGDREFCCFLWDIEAQQSAVRRNAAPIAKLSHNTPVASLAWVLEGQTLAVGTQSRNVQLYDMRVGGANAPPLSALAHNFGVHGIEVNPHKQFLMATFSRADGEPVKIWDIRRMDSVVGEIKVSSSAGNARTSQPSQVESIKWSTEEPGVLSVAQGGSISDYDTWTASRPVLTRVNHGPQGSTVKDFALYQKPKVSEADASVSQDPTDRLVRSIYPRRMLAALDNNSLCDMAKHGGNAPLAISRRDGSVVHSLGQTVWIASAASVSDPSLQEDISATMMRRAHCHSISKYSADTAKNIQILSENSTSGEQDTGDLPAGNQSLIRLWSWIERVEEGLPNEIDDYEAETLSLPKSILEAGVISLLATDGPTPKEDVHFSESFDCNVYDSTGRRLAMSSCGWAGKTRLENVIADCQVHGDNERAAALAVWHGEVGLAVGVLQEAASALRNSEGDNGTSQYAETLDLTAMCVAGYGGSNSSQSMVWRMACSSLLQRSDIVGPDAKHSSSVYLKALCQFLLTVGSGTGFDKVLENQNLSCSDRVAFACMYLDRGQLHAYLDKSLSKYQQMGNVEGIIVTGLSKEGIKILQAFVDRTCDVQTAALIVSRVSLPADWVDERKACMEWIESYRALLNTWQMWQSRAQTQMARGECKPVALEDETCAVMLSSVSQAVASVRNLLAES